LWCVKRYAQGELPRKFRGPDAAAKTAGKRADTARKSRAKCRNGPGPALLVVATTSRRRSDAAVTAENSGYARDDALRLNHLQAKRHPRELPRKVELDLFSTTSSSSFEVYHLPGLDQETTRRRFTDCLRSLRSWSDLHRGHYPILIQIEPKTPFPSAGVEEYSRRRPWRRTGL
jgi:hypothetical protein